MQHDTLLINTNGNSTNSNDSDESSTPMYFISLTPLSMDDPCVDRLKIRCTFHVSASDGDVIKCYLHSMLIQKLLYQFYAHSPLAQNFSAFTKPASLSRFLPFPRSRPTQLETRTFIRQHSDLVKYIYRLSDSILRSSAGRGHGSGSVGMYQSFAESLDRQGWARNKLRMDAGLWRSDWTELWQEQI